MAKCISMINLMTFLGKKSLYLDMNHVKSHAQVDLIFKKSKGSDDDVDSNAGYRKLQGSHP